MDSQNICYQSDELERFYSRHRRHWADFYPSEKWIIQRIAGAGSSMGGVLDIGCATGGLGQALSEEFHLDEYVGVEINPQCVEAAFHLNKINAESSFYCADVLDCPELSGRLFDNVFSLGCADFNVRTEDIIGACWSHVRSGGNFILTLRLTKGPTLKDISKSYQYICFSDELPENKGCLEKAPYVVFNTREALSLLVGLTPRPERITAFGYWGPPSRTARTLESRLVFTAVSVQKGNGDTTDTVVESHLPASLYK